MSISLVRKKCGMGPIDWTRRRAIVLRICVSGTSCEPWAAAPTDDGGPMTDDGGCADDTSRAMTRPDGPLPATDARSTPFSAAMRRARGEDKMRDPGPGAWGPG